MNVLKSYLLLSIVLSLFIFSACDDTNENEIDYSAIISITNTENIESSVGNFVTLYVKVLDEKAYNQGIQLYVGETKVNYTDGYDDNNRFIRFIVTEDMVNLENAPITLRLNEKVIAQGITLTTKTPKTYLYYYLNANPLTAGRVVALSQSGGNEVYTINAGIMGDARNVSIKFDKSNGKEFPELNYDFSPNFDFPTPAENTKPFAIISGDKWGYAYKNGTAYAYFLYGNNNPDNDGHYIIKYKDATTSFIGQGNYSQLFESRISEIQADTDNNLYVMTADKPTCIYKMNETTPAALWVGSETVSGSKDGSKGDARFEDIVGFQIDNKNNLYVAQKTVIRKITPDGTVTTLDKFNFSDIRAIAVSPDNSIYVLNEEIAYEINVINPDQTAVTSCKVKNGYIPTQDIGISGIQNMAVTADGIIYVTRYSSGVKSSSLQVFVPEGM